MRYLCIALCQKKRKLKLNKLNKISGLSRWEAKATERISVSIRWGWGVWRPTWPPVCGEGLWPASGGWGERATPWQSRSSASLRYFFGAVSSPGGGVIHAGHTGLRLLADRRLFLLQAAPAGLVQPHVAQHGLGQTRVGETGPLYEQRLRHVRHEAWRDVGDRSQTVQEMGIRQKHWPIWIFPTVLDSLSQRGLTSSLCFFSISPEIAKTSTMHQLLQWQRAVHTARKHNGK